MGTVYVMVLGIFDAVAVVLYPKVADINRGRHGMPYAYIYQICRYIRA